MNILIIFGLSLFLIVRILGFLVSLDFYYNKRDVKFIFFMLSWIFFIIGTLFALLFNIGVKNFLNFPFLTLNVFFVIIATILYSWAIGKYFISISNKFMILLILFVIIIILIGHIFQDNYLVYSIVAMLIGGTVIVTFIIPPASKEFRKKMGKSLRWYYITIIVFFSYIPLYIITYSLGYGYGLYDVTADPVIILINYLSLITATILLIILLIHLEYNISDKQKFELKDKYSHNLGNIMQVISCAQELIHSEINSKEQRIELRDLIDIKINEVSKLIREIREL